MSNDNIGTPGTIPCIALLGRHMMWSTHMVGGAAAWLGFTALMPVPEVVAVVGLPVAAVAALGPDIDSRNAKATRSLGWGTYGLHLWLKRHLGEHREGMHSIIRGIPLIGLLSAAVMLGLFLLLGWRSDRDVSVPWQVVASSGLAGFVGALSHSLLDSPTNGGVKWLWPWRDRKYGFYWMTVGGWGESVVARPVLVVLAGVAGVATISGW